MAAWSPTPSIIADPDFDPEADAEACLNAIEGTGTDEDALIDVLANRTNAQRQKIARQYHIAFDRDLAADLESELSGDLEETMLGMMKTPGEYDAYWLRKAMKGLGTNEALLIEILCTRSSEEIEDARRAFEEEYKSSLVSDIESETSGDFMKTLVALVSVERDPEGPVDIERATCDAEDLLKAGEKKLLGTDEDKFIEIFTRRSRAHLKVVFEQYGNISKYDIEKSLDREMSGDFQDALVTIVKWVRNPAVFFANLLHKSMAGLGTNDDMLQRVLISRSEIDLVDIATAFNENHKTHKKTLLNWISNDVSGDYKKALLAILK